MPTYTGNHDALIDVPGVSVIHYTDDANQKKIMMAHDPLSVIHQHFAYETPHIKEKIRQGLANNSTWVVATSYEWGCAQLGIAMPTATAIFIEYKDVRTYNSNDMGIGSKRRRKENNAPCHPVELSPHWQHQDFILAIAHAKQCITEGDVYQLNISYPCTITSNHTIQDVYRHMQNHHSPSHGAFICTDEWAIASASPEELFYMRNGHIRTQPIQGTIGRSTDSDADNRARLALLASKKDHAELLMITDLMRNDLGQLAQPGSVAVPHLCEIQPHHYVYHLASCITATLRPEVTGWDALCALAPGGSITGCPKVSACTHIDRIEGGPRQFYTGHIGFISPKGEAAFNVAIRTCYKAAGTGIQTHTGCGITIDSNASDEYQESRDKLGFLSPFAITSI